MAAVLQPATSRQPFDIRALDLPGVENTGGYATIPEATTGRLVLLRPTQGLARQAQHRVQQETNMGNSESRSGDREPWRRPEQFNPDSEGWARPVGRGHQREGTLREVARATRDFGARLREILVSDRPR